MKFRMVFASLVLSFLTSAAWAADLSGVSGLFSGHFWGSFYQPGRCGQNTETLIRLALQNGVDLNGAHLVYIENKGFSNFGLVAAYRAREQGSVMNAGEAGSDRARRRPGRANWSFHAFLLVDGQVLDFDFDNQPHVLPLKSYVSAMFLPASADARSSRVLAEYEASVYRIRPVSPGESFRVPRQGLLESPQTMTLSDLLNLSSEK